jgi:hypothetical protein
MEFTDALPSPRIWRKWAGIFTLASAMERRMWIRTSIGNLYPNLYVMLVGPPGVGKTIMTSQARNFLFNLCDTDPTSTSALHLAAASETHASIVDALREANRRHIGENMEMDSYNSLCVVSNELGTMLPEYNATMMSKLTDIYDGQPYSERRRTKELNFVIPAPQINFLAATTPSFLVDSLPPGAWDQGFLSRTIVVFSTEMLYRDLFAQTTVQDQLGKELMLDLRHIFGLYGKLTFTEDAVTAIRNWDKAGRVPLPDHPKLLHYNTRRAAHLLKLCMVSAISSSDKLQVGLEQVHEALDWLVEVEVNMPDIFKAMNTGGDSRAMEDVWYQIALLYMKEQKPVYEGRIVAYLAERIPAQNVARVLDVMIRTGIFKEATSDTSERAFIPKTRKF